MIKKLINRSLSQFGYGIHKIYKKSSFSMEAALERCIDRGLIIKSVIDIGASDGRWSEMCIKLLPNARFLLIEAQEEHRLGLERFKNLHPDIEYIIAAAGSKSGTLYFDNADLFGGLASDTHAPHLIQVPSVTIDDEIKRLGLEPPFLIKLDTHGFEVPILVGASQSLGLSSLVIIEAYNYKIAKNSLKFYELCTYMDQFGFSCIEVADFLLRRYDNSFWQMDLFFIPSISKEFTYNKFV